MTICLFTQCHISHNPEISEWCQDVAYSPPEALGAIFAAKQGKGIEALGLRQEIAEGWQSGSIVG